MSYIKIYLNSWKLYTGSFLRDKASYILYFSYRQKLELDELYIQSLPIAVLSYLQCHENNYDCCNTFEAFDWQTQEKALMPSGNAAYNNHHNECAVASQNVCTHSTAGDWVSEKWLSLW